MYNQTREILTSIIRSNPETVCIKQSSADCRADPLNSSYWTG